FVSAAIFPKWGCYKISTFTALVSSDVLVDMTGVIRQRNGLIMHSWFSHLQVLTQRKKLEIVQKEKDDIQRNVNKFKHVSKSLNKLIECQIVDDCKKSLGYENYNAVPPPYTGNSMPPTPDLSIIGLDKFVNEPVVKNYKAMSIEEDPKVVRKYDDALRIKEWVSDDEEKDVS
ncbi:hypothetical protein Tco_0101171, partial [Tanacetum coccineum]